MTSFVAREQRGSFLIADGGSLEVSSHTYTVALLAVAVLGFSFCWNSVGLGVRVEWIGAQLTVEGLGISGALPKDKLNALYDQASRLRSFVGMVWAALASSSWVPSELVHCRRSPVARWLLQALLSEFPCPLAGIFPVTASWASR